MYMLQYLSTIVVKFIFLSLSVGLLGVFILAYLNSRLTKANKDAHESYGYDKDAVHFLASALVDEKEAEGKQPATRLHKLRQFVRASHDIHAS